MKPLHDSESRILACGTRLTGASDSVPLTVDFARWTGPTGNHVPAAVFVFRASKPGNVAVFVTDPACDNLYIYNVVPLP